MLEGGGQILRNAAALSAITGTPIIIDRIRAKRRRPGLRPQHLTGLELVVKLCNGQLVGGYIDSVSVSFVPGPLHCVRAAVADTGTAGSCMLLAQVALPCLLFVPGEENAGCTESQLRLQGGTDAAMAPPIGYFAHVLLPTLRLHLGVEIDLELERRGFFPRGQGIADLKVTGLKRGSCLPPLILIERGRVVEIAMTAFTAGRLNLSIGERMVTAAKAALQGRGILHANSNGIRLHSEVYHEAPDKALGDGCGILLVARTDTGRLFGASGIGERGVAAETIGLSTATELADVLESGAAVDDWMADQLIIFMALAKGKSCMLTREPTLHTRTAVAVAEMLTTARFKLTPQSGGLWHVTCQGAGWPAPGKVYSLEM